ncbi:MAG: ABC transporter ATP-binding protein, partial [Saprospiraceae bacterium]|nr:ABC transporter ATP-binding protein [Saprospiraceae bacterium]
LRTSIFDHLSGLHPQYFDKTPIGQSTTRTINDTETINTMVSQGVIPMIADILTLVAFFIAMIITSVKLTFIVLLVIPLLIIASRVFTNKVRAAYQRLRNELAKMNTFLQERISGMQIIQIFNAEKQEMEKFKKINRAYTQENINNIFYYAIFFPVVEVLSAFALALMVWWGGRGVLDGSISLGDLVAFPLFLSGMFRPIRMLADKFNYLQLGMVATDRVFKALDIENNLDNAGTIQTDKLKGHIEYRDVHFSYNEDEEVLKGVNFEIPAGQSLAIVGSTGSGKTTIINLLGRLYDIKEGDILIDGVSIRDYDLFSIRQKMAVVLQDVFLFGGTILDNIRLMEPSISEEEIIEASKKIGAHPFFEKLPGGYHFKVMERGGNLSLGQRQLISFVRALVFDPDILILDEATSSIDVETEAVIQHAIEKLITKRTSIIIAHRLSTVKKADRILVMKKGKIVQSGTHEELIAETDGLYFQLNQMQIKDLAIQE